MADAAGPQEGFYSSTSGTWFPDKESLAHHYQSDLHRYNLKRKVAGLPPVTKEWFEARKEQLTLGGGAGEEDKMYYDPLTRKKYKSKNSYMAAIGSNKYKELVRKSGQPAPAPIVTSGKRTQPEAQQPGQKAEAGVGYTATPAPLSLANSGKPAEPSVQQAGGDGEESEWESASDDDEAAPEGSDMQTDPISGGNNAQSQPAANTAVGAAADSKVAEDASQWEEWDLRRSLFDNHVSPSFEANLDYMFKNFGFYFPDAEYLSDPEGLLKYLGAKLQYGHVPLGTRGEDAQSKQFASLHAVQRHMVDRNACKLIYDDNEDEYDDFYDYSALDDGPEGQDIVMADGSSDGDARLGTGNMELMLPGTGDGKSGGGKVLGNRSFALFYRQRHPRVEQRQSVAANIVLARYRALNIATQTPTVAAPVKVAQRKQRRYERANYAAQVKDTENRARRQVQGPGHLQR